MFKLKFASILVLALVTLSACTSVKHASRTAETDALLRAAAAGNADSVRTLVASPNIDVNGVDENGNTPLIEAARMGHDDVVQVLLIAKADPNIKNKAGKTALQLASEGGHEESVALLTQAGTVNR
jgi:ankyrin repeat protein